ncbi:MAG TPA: PHB depolymerase family esterase [Candidatus Baltobacteraceae bacterium]|nr:PHB depolymerase family esterase [Candidatus Baltobacteraceae bacterium]
MLAPALAAATLLALGTPSLDLRISVTRERLVAESPWIRSEGVNPYDFIFRLDYLRGQLEAVTDAQRRADLEQEAQLELRLDAELLVNLCPTFEAIDSGFDESFYNDDPRSPPDPVAFYLPKTNPQSKYALVVVLHGRQQTETDVVSREVLRALADRRHAILVAPFGTGSVLWSKESATEIVAIVREMVHGFAIDPQRIYLAGVGLGGEGVFRIATSRAEPFHAFLSLEGALEPDDAFAAIGALRSRFVYLVGQSVTYTVLARNCVPVSYYPTSENGTGLYQTDAQLQQAWDDMFDGVIRNSSTRECSAI